MILKKALLKMSEEMKLKADVLNGKETVANPDEKHVKEETELDKYWKSVKDNPSDFTGWTYLLQFVEQEDNITAAREAYDSFFTSYPYCYGYWKRYADMEKKRGNAQKAVEVFERGTKAIALSVELWIHYVNHHTNEFKEKSKDKDGVDEEWKKNHCELVRSLYESAITAAGTDFRSDKLWDSYITWEKQNGDLVKVTALYDRLLSIPTQLYSHHFDNFKEFIESNKPKLVLNLDEFLRLRKEIVAESEKVKEEPADEDSPPGCEDAPPGCDVPPGEEAPPGLEENQVADEEVGKLREKIIAERKKVFQKTEEEVSKRWQFEEGIKRPYFHVKPLERSQLKNWREYLDFEIQNGSHERVVVLFERCMISSALYEDFWLKYARYLEKHSTEAVRSVYRRACEIHLRKKPFIHMAWSSFEERQDCYSEAYRILCNLEKNVPDLLMVAMRRISLERRMGHLTEADELFQQYIDSSASFEIRSFYSIKYARFLRKFMHDDKKAKQILKEAIELDKSNEKLYLQLLDLEFQSAKVSEGSVGEIFSSVLESELNLECKVRFSQRRLQFIEDFGEDVLKALDAYEEHQRLLKDLGAERKKKQQEIASEEPPTKRQKTGTESNGNGKTTEEETSVSQQTAVSMSNSVADAQQVQPQYNYAPQWNYNNSVYPYVPQQWPGYPNYYPTG